MLAGTGVARPTEILFAEVLANTTRATPRHVIDECEKRLREWDSDQLGSVVTVDAESYEVSNRALVDSWPTAEVAALAAAHGGPTWLVVEQRVVLTTGDLVVPGVQRAFAAARTVELARAAHATTLAFSVRAGPDVHFSRVLSAVYAAGTNGYADPVLVLASPRGEVGLALRPGSARPEALGAPQADEIVDPSDEDLARVDEILQEAQAGRAPPPRAAPRGSRRACRSRAMRSRPPPSARVSPRSATQARSISGPRATRATPMRWP